LAIVAFCHNWKSRVSAATAPVLTSSHWAAQERMRQFGKVDIPQEAFIAALKVDV